MAHERKQSETHVAFAQAVSAESLQVFNDTAKKAFKDQCVFFLNAFWEECGDHAEWIYMVTRNMFQMADMQSKGISSLYSYEEGCDLDFDMGLYVFEQHLYFVDNPTNLKFKQFGLPAWALEEKDYRLKYSRGIPQEMTAQRRKIELRDKVDVNFDGRVSALEFLLYQFDVSPQELMARSMAAPDEHPEVKAARLALIEVQKAVKAYELKKQRLTEASQANGGRGVAALRARNQLAQLNSSPEWDALNKAIITAEAKVRICVRRFGGSVGPTDGDGAAGSAGPGNSGALFWMERELKEAKARYGGRAPRGSIKK